MAKRSGSSDIDRDNWDDPLASEEAGTFKTAPPEVLKQRVLKTAKRSLTPSSNRDVEKSVFANFGGFKPVTSATPTAPFKFLSSLTSSNSAMPIATPTTPIATPTTPIATPTTPLATPTTPLATPTMPSPSLATSATSTNGAVEDTAQQQYLATLKQLNHSVLDWIKSHVDSNPLCILTPVFSDYDKHLKKIREDRDKSKKSTPVANSFLTSNIISNSESYSNKFLINITSTDTVKKTFTFTDTNVKANTSVTSKASSPESCSGNSPLLQKSNDPKPSIFSAFKSENPTNLLSKPHPTSLMANPFTSIVKKEPESSPKKTEEEENESDEPPKVDYKPIEEEGSVFSTRCKVFVKKDNNYKDKGVGTLFIKKIGDEEKYQLLVRAETVMGNVLVNVLLTTSVPTQRMGKNNVMMVCMPTPQDLPPPTTVLLRVKTADEADNLLSTLNKYKP